MKPYFVLLFMTTTGLSSIPTNVVGTKVEFLSEISKAIGDGWVEQARLLTSEASMVSILFKSVNIAEKVLKE